ncbi:glutaredoxin 3 [Zooshikella marina]|uniref:Glutaredoxin n=1 Tax=Zooshikella ganghwensis TaxID=202772 RepID=A0A4V1IP73_9GAMM|nr:glutaredoxin 3 [Zooshikella ganghwensis]MBU2708565.1 glutaredoxin 3 [Zooshikella ganghwensis]RDH46231.1 glutaredoxin 3 [Zooshikella ganghwensis]
MSKVVIYSSAYCPFCIRALRLLDAKAVDYQLISVDGQPNVRREMTEKAGRTSVPQIWIGTTHVGGCDDLYALEAKGELDRLLSQAQ